jgi:hypothetical protein
MGGQSYESTIELGSRIQNDESCSFTYSSFNAKVPVEVVIGIRGDLTSPEPDFNIEFPTVSNVLKSEIQYKLNDKDTTNSSVVLIIIWWF